MVRYPYISEYSATMSHNAASLVELNIREAEMYCRMATEREKYHQAHPTEIGNSVCMDGRVNLKRFTLSLPGIIQNFRKVGGQFNLAWPMFQSTLKTWRAYAHSRDRDCLFFVTYHYSRGDVHRGCAGFNYETDKAIAFTSKLKQKFVSTFDEREVSPRTFRTIHLGLETDLDALIFHGDDGERLDLAEATGMSETDLLEKLRQMYRRFPLTEQMERDVVVLMQRNLTHIAKVRQQNRTPVEIQHCEWILAIGRSFDWLPDINTALIVGSYNDSMMRKGIVTAGNVLLSNIIEETIQIDDNNRVVLLTCVPYYETDGPEPHLAALKAEYMDGIAHETLKKHTPALLKYTQRLVATMDQNTRRFNVLYSD